jgi:hypothetical protein
MVEVYICFMKLKFLFFAALLLLVGCTSLVFEDSSPSRVIIQGHSSNPNSFAYTEAQSYCNKYGANAVFNKKIDGEAYRISKGCTRWCGSEYNYYEFSCEKNIPKRSLETPKSQIPIAPAPSQPVELDVAKKKCSDLGFKSGTEEFGKCVLQLSK